MSYTDADVELVARALADLVYGSEDDHAPWNYTEFGTECTCGAAIVGDDWCTANWDHMPDEGKDNYRTEARAILSALAAAGRLPPAGGQTGIDCEIEWTDLRSSRPGARVQIRRYQWAPDTFDAELARLLDPSVSPHIVPVRAFKRIVTTWPDGTTLIGPWQPVPTDPPAPTP